MIYKVHSLKVNPIMVFFFAMLLSFFPSNKVEAMEPVILCFGDSLTAGWGVLESESYPTLLQKKLIKNGFPHKVVNAGISGDTTASGLNRVQWSLRTKPSLVILVLGANDGLRGLQPKEMQENLNKIINIFKDKNIPVIIGGMKLPPNYGITNGKKFNQVFSQLAAQHKAPFIPFFLEGVAGHPELNQGDGIHPNAEGYKIITENVWRVLKPLL
ncbi:MAG: arylesterase [Magnetococcales bacterium]|nr:arylesterase [Magnetococcales bacterium]